MQELPRLFTYSLVRMWDYVNVSVLQLSDLQMVPHLPLVLLLGGAPLFSLIERTRIEIRNRLKNILIKYILLFCLTLGMNSL